MLGEVRVKIYDIVWGKPDIVDWDWYCESCDDYLNDQGDFSYCCGIWECIKCGHENYISENSIDDDDDDLPTADEDNFYIDKTVDELDYKIRCYLYEIYGRKPESFKYDIVDYCENF